MRSMYLLTYLHTYYQVRRETSNSIRDVERFDTQYSKKRDQDVLVHFHYQVTDACLTFNMHLILVSCSIAAITAAATKIT